MFRSERLDGACVWQARRQRLWVGGFAAILAVSAAGSVRAADAAGASPDESKSGQLEEIVVTAQRRVENLQTTAIAASVLDAAALERKSVVNMYDLQDATPGLTINSAGVVALVNIRGIGLDSNSPQVVPGVASYRDGLWQPPIANTAQFFDLASVEVLRGPQGTFVGSNSTGGAIFYNSKSPELGASNGYVQVQGGNYADVGASGAVNLPIDSTFAARVAFNVERRDSFYKNPNSKTTPTGIEYSTPGALDEKAMRVGLMWKPDDTLQALFKSELEQKSTGGYGTKPIPNTPYAAFASPDPWTLDYDEPTKADERTMRNSLEIRWQPSPDGITYRSLTGYQHLATVEILDTDATSSKLPGLPATSQYGDIVEKPFSEEINIISPASGRLQWILGGYYLHDTRQVGIDIRSQAFPPHVLIDWFTTLENLAAFGQISYKIAPRLEFEIGGRFTHDSVSNPSDNYINIGPNVVLINAGGRHTDGVATGKAALNWTPNDDNFVYAFVAKGYKAGGFDFGAPPIQFRPEFVWDYELGWKSNFFDHRVRAQLGGFWNDYTNLQVAAINTSAGNNSLTNIGKSTIKGFEAQIEGQLGALRVDAGGAYVKSTLGAITLVNTRLLPGGGAVNLGPQCAPGAGPPGCFDYSPLLVSVSGRANPYSPKWTFNTGVEYAFALAGGTLTPRINYSYIGEQWTTLIQAPLTDRLSSFGLWNTSLTYVNGDWRVEAYGMNIANKTYVAGQLNNNEFFGNPRQVGMRISRSF
jgi:iron complex outermembrane receptor protein